jgi:dihydroorotase
MLTRREFSRYFLAGSTALLGSDKFLPAGNPPVYSDQSSSQDCNLLIKGGTVIDPGQHLHAALDVAVKDGKILEVSRDFPEDRARRVVSAKDRIVTPGLIDLHALVFEGVASGGVNADHYCMGRGVTTVVDTSSGYPLIAGLRKYVINTSSTRIYAVVDIYAVPTIGTAPRQLGGKSVMENLEWVNPQLTAKAAEENKPAVVGISVRMEEDDTGSKDLEILKRALEAAEASRLPLMALIDKSYSPLPDILKMLRKGDVFSLFLNDHQHRILDANGKILPEVWEARKRGILFDPAQGSRHLSFDVAEKCLEQNFLPDTISTGLSNAVVNGPVFDLPAMISKFMAIGMDLDKAIELTTIKPAQVFNYGLQLGTLRPGSEADIGIFELQEGKFEFVDSGGEKRTGRQKLVNKAAICRGQLFVNET